jgi:hypothetical protein
MASFVGEPVDFSVTTGASAYPRATYLSNGDILGVYTAFPLGTDLQQLTLVTSSNSGASWTFTGTAATRPTIESTLDNPYPLQLPSGRVLLAFRNHDRDSTGKWAVYRITICSSDDLGRTWHFLSDAVVAPATPSTNNGVWEPFLRTSQDGSVQLYYSRERGPSDQDNVVVTSLDGGMSWTGETYVSGALLHGARDGMVGVAATVAGSLIAVFESNSRGGVFSLNSVCSADDGKTWMERRTIYTSPNGRNAGAPQIIRVGTMLVVSFMTDEDRGVDGEAEEEMQGEGKEEEGRPESGIRVAKWPDIAAGKMLVSRDGGATWTKELEQVFPIHAAWPGLLALKAGDGSGRESRRGGERGLLYLAGHDGLKCQRVVLSDV